MHFSKNMCKIPRSVPSSTHDAPGVDKSADHVKQFRRYKPLRTEINTVNWIVNKTTSNFVKKNLSVKYTGNSST